MQQRKDFKETDNQMFYPEQTPRRRNKGGISPFSHCMIFQTIDQLKLSDHSFVLEIGFENTDHLSFLFQKFKGIHYYGIGNPEPQVQKSSSDPALGINRDHTALIQEKKNGTLDFANEFFDSCFTVNAICFWKNPLQHFREIYRVLQPGGKINLAFIEKKNAGNLPWTQVDFTFYDTIEVKAFLRETGFLKIEVNQMTEETIDEEEKRTIRPFVMVVARK